MATAPIRHLAWEPPYAVGVAQEMAKRQQTNKQNQLSDHGATRFSFFIFLIDNFTEIRLQLKYLEYFRSSHRGAVVNESD